MFQWLRIYIQKNVSSIILVNCLLDLNVDSHNINTYDIVHFDNFMLRNMFWQKCGFLLG